MVGYTLDLCFVHPRRHFSSACLPQPFHLLATHRTLSLTLSLLFIHHRINQRPRSRPKTQYIILGPYPYNSPSKLRFFPSYSRRNSGVLIFECLDHLFLRFTLVKHCFVCPVTAPDALEPAIPHLMFQAALCSPYPTVRDKSYG